MNKIKRVGLTLAATTGMLFVGTGAASASVAPTGWTWGDRPNVLLGTTQNHEDPCSGQHIQVYNENSYVELPHFVCGTGSQGPKGDTGPKGDDGAKGNTGETGATGAQGPKGDTGADSTVPGPKGDTGPAGADGADSTVAGPKGDTGADGKDGTDGAQGPAGANATAPVPVVLTEAAGENCIHGGLVVFFKASEQAEGTISGPFYVCNGVDGLPGLNGVDGLNGASITGPAGKDGVSKTVIVKQDGTVQTITNLPKTGNSGHNWQIAGLGVLTLVAGAGIMVAARRARNS